jgi:hypothetical protein
LAAQQIQKANQSTKKLSSTDEELMQVNSITSSCKHLKAPIV